MYAAISFGLSLLALVLATIYTARVTNSYHQWHDERAAVSLGKAIGLWVVAFGCTLSASGSVLAGFGYHEWHGPMAQIGLAVARGALIVTMATLVLADVRPGGRPE